MRPAPVIARAAAVSFGCCMALVGIVLAQEAPLGGPAPLLFGGVLVVLGGVLVLTQAWDVCRPGPPELPPDAADHWRPPEGPASPSDVTPDPGVHP